MTCNVFGAALNLTQPTNQPASTTFVMVFVYQSLIVRDRVREFLEKDPAQRTDDDINVLLDFMQHLPVRTLSAMLAPTNCRV